jgi:hypothetical protein
MNASPTIPHPPLTDWRAPVPPKKKHRWLTAAVVALSLAVLGGALPYRRAVTADPGLYFDNFNVFRAAAGDKTGIEDLRNTLGTESKVDFVSGGTFVAYVALYNGGARGVRVEAIPESHFHYWGLSGAALSTDDRTAFVGEDYVPLRPFTLGKGETAYLRLDFRMADCGNAPMEEGWSSTIDSLRLTYETLGFTRTLSVPFEESAISVLAGGECEHPLIEAAS